MQFIASQLIIDIISNPLIYIATNSNLKTQNSEKSSIFALVTMQSVSSIYDWTPLLAWACSSFLL